MSETMTQTTSASTDVGYNGWMNYETWLVDMWLSNEQNGYAILQALCAESESIYRTAGALEEWVREQMAEHEPSGMAADLVSASLSRVNWVEIIQDNRS